MQKYKQQLEELTEKYNTLQATFDSQMALKDQELHNYKEVSAIEQAVLHQALAR